jgi:hypothetical protein
VPVEARHWHREIKGPLLHLGISLKPRKKPNGSTPTLVPHTVILPPPRYLTPLQQPFVYMNDGPDSFRQRQALSVA